MLIRSQYGLILMVLLLGACGFHLRGTLLVPARYQPLYIQADASSLPVAQRLRENLTEENLHIADELKQAKTVVFLSGTQTGRRVLSISGGSGRLQEVELTSALTVEVKDISGTVLIPLQHLSLHRDFTFDETVVLAKDAEEKILREEIQDDLLGRVRRILSILGKKQ